jgi:Holliday junction resolvase RusA-like endonuclease
LEAQQAACSWADLWGIMVDTYSLFVPGRPGSAGSKTVYRTKEGKNIVTPASKYQKPWMDSVRWAFMQTYGRPVPLTGPIDLRITFYLKRPKSHYRTQNGQISHQLKPGAPIWHISMPDRTKLLRASEDALTGIAWRDDAQVCCGMTNKVYADGPTGAQISISTIEKENL